MPYDNLFKLKKPCSNCPFRKEGAIRLDPGRLEGIIENITKDDWSAFYCHKTVHNNRTGGDWANGQYQASGDESYCTGSMIYLEKIDRPSVGMRMGHLHGMFDPQELRDSFDDVIDPPET